MLTDPGPLRVNTSNENSLSNIAYLDLSISVTNNNFEVKVYAKTDDYNFTVITLPFLSSNISTEMCFYFNFSQILRFLRICIKLNFFKDRAIFLTRLLQDRGYSSQRLASKFNEVLHCHIKDWRKFSREISCRDLILAVVYGV